MNQYLSKKVGLVLGGIILLSAFFQVLQEYFGILLWGYHRISFHDTFWWQWLTPSLVHMNWMHWLLNILNLIALVMIFASAWNIWRLVSLFISSSFIIMICLYLFSPNIMYYVGMSGVLYALVVYSALLCLKQQPFISSTILVYVTLKLTAHDWVNQMMGVDKALSNMPIVTDVHWYGTIIGIIFFIIHKVYIFFTIK